MFFSKRFTSYTKAKQEVVSKEKATSLKSEEESCSGNLGTSTLSQTKKDISEAAESSTVVENKEDPSQILSENSKSEKRNKLLSERIGGASPLGLLVENRLGRITDGLREGGSYFSINSFAPKRSVTPPIPEKKISYCDSDDENSASSSAFANEMRYPWLDYGCDRLSPNAGGSLFQYDRPFAKSLPYTAPNSDDDSGSLFEEDKRFEWVDRIWDESPRNDPPINDIQEMQSFADLQPRPEFNKDVDFARSCRPESSVGPEFTRPPTTPVGKSDVSDKGSRVHPTCLDILANLDGKDFEQLQLNTRLMAGMHVMVTGGPVYGSFGRIEKCLNGFCEVYLFMSKSFETVQRMISNEFLVPMIPDRDMKLKVEFVSKDAAIYFCPNKYEGNDENGKAQWSGMKIWTVVNPALKQAIPEGSILEKINDLVVTDMKFEDVQDQFENLTVPYSLTMQFPQGIQQIKMTELYMSELSLGPATKLVEKKTRIFSKDSTKAMPFKKHRKKGRSSKLKKRNSPRAFGRERRVNVAI